MENKSLIQFKIDKLYDEIRHEALKSKILKKEHNITYEKWLKESSDLKKKTIGLNLYGFLAGLITYHTAHLYTKKVLINEIGKNGALLHMGVCLTVGLVSGWAVGKIIGINFSLKNKAEKINDMLRH